jgi:hypothetical protein
MLPFSVMGAEKLLGFVRCQVLPGVYVERMTDHQRSLIEKTVANLPIRPSVSPNMMIRIEKDDYEAGLIARLRNEKHKIDDEPRIQRGDHTGRSGGGAG